MAVWRANGLAVLCSVCCVCSSVLSPVGVWGSTPVEVPSIIPAHPTTNVEQRDDGWRSVVCELPLLIGPPPAVTPRPPMFRSRSADRASVEPIIEIRSPQRSMMLRGAAIRSDAGTDSDPLQPISYHVIDRGHGLRITFPLSTSGECRLVIWGEVPAGWRGDLWETRFVSSVEPRGVAASETSVHRSLIGLYAADDPAAGIVAHQFARFDRTLLDAAKRHAAEIRAAQYPTPLHQMGAALDLYQPTVPSDWLDQVRFEHADPNAELGLRKLPVDTRVAILDYRDARLQLERLAHPTPVLLTATSSPSF